MEDQRSIVESSIANIKVVDIEKTEESGENKKDPQSTRAAVFIQRGGPLKKPRWGGK